MSETDSRGQTGAEQPAVIATTPAHVSAQAPPKARDRLDWALAYIQFLTLVFLIIYVVKTWQIAVATEDATRIAAKAAKAQVAVTLEEKVDSDESTQHMLDLIFDHNDLVFKEENQEPMITSHRDSKEGNMERKLDVTLNRFQIIGHLYKLGVLDKGDLAGLRYEIIEIGRNKAVRSYFDFLNHRYQGSSGITHDHFRFLKEMYLDFEYDSKQKEEFQNYLFQYPAGIDH